MMGPMMGGGSGWQPMLIVPLIVLAVLAAAVLVVSVARRSAGPGGRSSPAVPGRRGGDTRPAAGATPGEDPVLIVRERYAHGEISHAEFLHLLDQLLPAGQPAVPPAGPAPGRG